MKTFARTHLVAATIFILVSSGYAQEYEYISMYQVKAGIEDKAKIDFSWPDKPDSAKILNTLKFRDPLVAIQKMEEKGFELYSIHEYGPGSLVIVIDVYMRRRKN